MSKLLCLIGPTAIGKTELGLSLAKKFDGELVACDSRQVYKGLKIGAGKGEEKVWMYDVVDPSEQYNVSDYVKDATKIIKDIWSRGKLPLAVGGTYLYLRGLLGEIPYIHIPANEKLRAELENLSVEELQSRVVLLSPTEFASMNQSDRQNKRRLIRKVEILSMNPYINTSLQMTADSLQSADVLKIGLYSPRQVLNSKIDARVLSWIAQGLIKEGEKLHQEGLSYDRMRQLGLEYGILADFLEEKIDKDELIKRLQTKTHQYAKRQMSFFKQDKEIIWFNVTDQGWQEKVVKHIAGWYNAQDASQD